MALPFGKPSRKTFEKPSGFEMQFRKTFARPFRKMSERVFPSPNWIPFQK